MNIILFLLTAYGITNIIIFGSIFEGMRNFFIRINPSFLGKLVTCPLCSSTWVGFTMSFILGYLGYVNITPYGSLGLDNIYLRIYLDGCLTSGVVWLIHTLQEYFEK
jgi:hypothetical protein